MRSERLSIDIGQQRTQLLPARVDFGRRTVAGTFVQVHAAVRTQSSAVGPTQWLHRNLQEQRLTQHFAQIEDVGLVDQERLILLIDL